MKILQKVLVVLLIAMFIVTLTPVKQTFAYDVGNAIENMKGNANVDDNSVATFTTLGDTILTFLQILSGITAVVMIAITGFRYIVETPEVKGVLSDVPKPKINVDADSIVVDNNVISDDEFFDDFFDNEE